VKKKARGLKKVKKSAERKREMWMTELTGQRLGTILLPT